MKINQKYTALCVFGIFIGVLSPVFLSCVSLEIQSKQFLKGVESLEKAKRNLQNSKNTDAENILNETIQEFNTYYYRAKQEEYTAKHTVYSKLVDDKGIPKKALIKLLTLDNLYIKGDTLKEIVGKTQKSWILTLGGVRYNQGKALDSMRPFERRDINDSETDKEQKKAFVKILSSIGFFDEIAPSENKYEYGAWLGAFLRAVRSRLNTLIDFVCIDNISIHEIVAFTGERKLQKEKNHPDAIELLEDQSSSPMPFRENWAFSSVKQYETEYDMMKAVWQQVKLPDSFKQMNMLFINAKPLVGGLSEVQNKRPTTEDTILAWLNESHPKPGTILAPSSPGLVHYQHLVISNILKKYNMALACDTVAEKLDNPNEMKLNVMKDTIAKILFELFKKQEMQENA